MKRIGIMTWYQYENYGTALQAGSLCEVIRQLGYEPLMIQYEPKKEPNDQTKINFHYIWKKAVKRITNHASLPYRSPERSRLYAEYATEMIPETEPCHSFPELSELNNQLDAFICGSDQIWSPLCFDDKYFLSFVSDPKKMISYAPSFGLTEIRDKIVRQQMAQLISRFPHLSVREKQGANLIKALCDKQSQIVLDPTLLINAQEWTRYLSEQTAMGKTIKSNYIICYFLGNSQKYKLYVEHLSRELNLPYWIIPVYQRQKEQIGAIPYEVGPKEFVSLILNAKYVCTDSFHGMAFAINFNIPFSALKRFQNNDPRNQNSRISSLLQTLGLNTRMQNYWNKPNKQELLSCNFSMSNQILMSERNKSLQYLKSALSMATQKHSVKIDSLPFVITSLCCGCGTCANVCPHNAITIQRNLNGFNHYQINKELCTSCGICRFMCPFVHVTAPSLSKARKLYSYKSTNTEVLTKSSSGGAAYDLACHFNMNGYWVCGAVYNPQRDCAQHVLISPRQPERLAELQGSKYIQSDSATAIGQIHKFPRANKLIFFGTPCQVAGLDKLLRKQGYRENAVLVDLICHGVPSQLLWERHIGAIEMHFHIMLHPNVSFRFKDGKWKPRKLKIWDLRHYYEKSETQDDFYAIFRQSLCNIETCYECPYRERSAADVRLGDYWGSRFANDTTGVSMVIANTLLGQKALEHLRTENRAYIEPHALEEYWNAQFPYNHRKPLIYDALLQDLKDQSLQLSKIRTKYCKRYDQIEKIQKLKALMKHILKPGEANER